VVLIVQLAGDGAPRDFMAPHTCGELALAWNYAKVLLATYPYSPARGDELPPQNRASHDIDPGPA
jgi:hypothetical protein